MSDRKGENNSDSNHNLSDFFEVNSMPEILTFEDYPNVITIRGDGGYRRDLNMVQSIYGTVIHKAISIYSLLYKYSDSTAESKGRYWISILSALDGYGDNLTELNISSYLLNGLRKRRYSDVHITTIMQTWGKTLRWCLSKNKYFSSEEVRKLHVILFHTPKLKSRSKEEQDPRKSLSQLCQELSYDDEEYLRSVRAYSAINFKIWSVVRDNFKSKCPEEYNRLFYLLVNNSSHSKILILKTPSIREKNFDKYKGIAEVPYLLVKSAIKLRDPILIECVFFSLAFRLSGRIRNYFDQFFCTEARDEISPVLTLEKMIEILSLFLDVENKRLIFQLYGIGDFVLTPSTIFSPYCLLFPAGREEEAFMQFWLFSDRHQCSNLVEMDLDDIVYDDKNLRVTSYKDRRKSNQDLIYKSSHDFYKAFRRYKRELLWAYDKELIPKIDGRYAVFPQYAKSREKKFLRSLLNIGHSPTIRFWLPTIKGTHYSRLLKKYLPNASFLDLLISSSKNNFPIQPTSITQTRIYVDELHDYSEYTISENMDALFDQESQEDREVAAEASGHSLTTRINTYYNRSKSRLKIDCEARFSAQVGNEMVRMALSILDVKANSSQLLSMDNAKQLCGITTEKDRADYSAEELLKQASMQNYVVDVTGLLESNGKIYIIKSPLHSELMSAYIRHIDESVDRLMISNHHLVPNVIAHRMFLSMMLEAFDEPIKRKGREMYGAHEFKFSDITVNVGL